MKGIERDHEIAFVLPHRYPESCFWQIDVQEVAAAQAKPGQCETVSKAAAHGIFGDRFSESSEQRASSARIVPKNSQEKRSGVGAR
jgi:hypothetical protein